jgi:para-nitrobenzyl esterase
MKISSLAAFIGMALCGPAALAQQAPEAVTASGRVRGVATDGVFAFKGNPFAAAPVGPLRWRAPQPVAAWTNVRDATSYGHDCMQKPVANDAAPLGTPPAEDCLYLNVWRPTAKAARRPVLVWIYGGGFLNGGASPPTYSGAELAKRGIVFVSFNYRVGRFGWFVHPQLTAEGAPGTGLGNYGFMDQIAALNWVRQNIAAFGGDPADVTVVGESAGGASVHTLLTSPMAQGLFQKAVIQSGGDGKLLMSDVASAEKAGLAFAASKGIDAADPGALAKLRGLSAEQVTDGLSMDALFAKTDGPPTFTLPMVDGTLAVDAPSAYAANRFNHVPVMLGATSADLFGPDGPMIAGGRAMARTFAAKGLPTYYYRFSYVADSARAENPKGAAHASDIPFFFATLDARYGTKTTARDRKVASAAIGYLANFVKAGDPNGPGLAAWPRYGEADPAMADFDAAGGMTRRPDR